MERGRPETGTMAAFAAIVVIGALNGIAIKFSNHDLAPFWGATLRFGLAAAIFWALVVVRRVPLPRGQALMGSILYGLLAFAASYTFIYWGLVDAPASVAIVILATTPLLTLLLAAAQGLEPFRWQGMIGALIAFSGIAVILGDQLGADAPPLSILACLAAAACFAETNVVVKRFPHSEPFANNAIAMGLGAGVLLAITLVTGSPIVAPSSTAAWIALIYLVVFGSALLFGLFLFVIARWTASATSYQLLLMPLVGVPVAALLLDEPLRATFVVGVVLSLVGVYLGAFAPPLGRLVPAIGRARPVPAAAVATTGRGTSSGPPDCVAGCP